MWKGKKLEDLSHEELLECALWLAYEYHRLTQEKLGRRFSK